MTHLLKLLGKMYKHEMDPTRTVGATERTRDVGRTDRRTDRVKPIYYLPTTSLCEGYNNREEVSYLEKMVTRLSFRCTLYQDTLDVHQLAYVIMMVADTLATSRWQVIYNHHVNSLVPGRCGCNLKLVISNSRQGYISRAFHVKLPWGECHKTSLLMSQHWFR